MPPPPEIKGQKEQLLEKTDDKQTKQATPPPVKTAKEPPARVSRSQSIDELDKEQVVPWIKLFAEFIGTFILVLTIGCCVLSEAPAAFGVFAIACCLTILVLSLGGLSGGHFNPSVTISCILGGFIHVQEGVAYIFVQLLAGVAGAGVYKSMFPADKVLKIKPVDRHHSLSASLCEFFYTTMLCMTVLHCGCTKQAGRGNSHYASLAIGLVIVAGGYGAGQISGGAFNPAVAFGTDIVSYDHSFGWSIVYIGWQVFAAAFATIIFRITRPAFQRRTTLFEQCAAEFIGTFFLVLTVGLNVVNQSPAAPLSIAAALISMIYCFADVSGSHFNPAVTLAIFCTPRCKLSVEKALSYVAAQILGSFVAANVYWFISNQTFGMGPAPGFSWLQAVLAEFIFTFLLCYTVHCMAVTTASSKYSIVFGLVIGSCVIVGGCAVGHISGAALNPAVAIGTDLVHAFWHGTEARHTIEQGLIYTVTELAAGAAAAGFFRITHMKEFEKEK